MSAGHTNAGTSSDEGSVANSPAAADRNDDPPSNSEWENYCTACYAASFERCGTPLALGYASALVPIHEFFGRTTSALYWPHPPIALGEGKADRGMEMGEFVY